MLIAHLSDLHLKDESDAVWLDRQLDRIAARNPDHLAMTGDLMDRWSPSLLDRILDSLEAHALLDRARLTILHGNHDLASSGGHPRRNADLWRLVLRFWDPAPVVRFRRRKFYEAIAARAPGVAAAAPFLKTARGGTRVAVLDTIPLLWRPIRVGRAALTVQHALGCIRGSEAQWLSRLRDIATPLVVLIHHYPLDTPPFQWAPPAGSFLPIRDVRVPMDIPQPARGHFWHAATTASVRLVLCGHVHRARLDWRDGIAVGLNGQSGAAWAGRTIAYYEVDPHDVRVDYEGV